MEFTDKEKLFLSRVAKQKNLYLTFCIASVIIAVFLLIYYGLIMRDITGTRFVIIILLLLAGRAHLRQYRSALILHKVKLWFDSSDNGNKVDKT
jgi:hypothetical protein